LPFNQNQTTRFGADPLLDQELATKAYVDNNSGGGKVYDRVVKLVDQTKNSDNTPALDDELFFNVEANKSYFAMLWMSCKIHTGPDLKQGWVVPAGTVGKWWDQLTNGNTAKSLITTISTKTTANTEQSYPLMCRFVTGGTAGVFGYQWSANTVNVNDCTIRGGSTLVAFEGI